ncbi:MAG: hypothetical protein ACKVVP_03295 [Chloroflexota bacterium]
MDTVELGGLIHPTGTVSFKLYGPDDVDCSAPPVFTSPLVPVNGNGTYQSAGFTPTGIGTYRWKAAYSGDGTNPPIVHPFNEPNEYQQIVLPYLRIDLTGATLGAAFFNFLWPRITQSATATANSASNPLVLDFGDQPIELAQNEVLAIRSAGATVNTVQSRLKTAK